MQTPNLTDGQVMLPVQGFDDPRHQAGLNVITRVAPSSCRQIVPMFSDSERIHSALKDMANLFTDALVRARRDIFESPTAVLDTRCPGAIKVANDDLL